MRALGPRSTPMMTAPSTAAPSALAVRGRYRGRDCRWLTVPSAERAALLATAGWFATPHDPRHAAPCMQLDAVGWRRIRAHLPASNALAAVPRARNHRGAGR